MALFSKVSGVETSPADEELMSVGEELRADRRLRPSAAAAALSVVGLLCGAALALASVRPSWSSAHVAPGPPLTVRSLLESAELADVATDNLMSMGRDVLAPLGRDKVRAHVAGRLQNISSAIRQSHPEDFQQMEALQLSQVQKGSVLRILRHYGDPRMLSLADDVTDAVRETVQEKGDHESLKRRLSGKLEPRLGEMRELAEEMFPGRGKHFTLNIEELDVVQQFAKWQPSVKVDFSRRLAQDDDVDGGVRVQVQTLFQSLEDTLGDKMPTAPARMLQSSSTAAGSEPKDGKEASFMECIMKAVPNPMSVMSCIAKNMQTMFKMVMNFVKGGR